MPNLKALTEAVAAKRKLSETAEVLLQRDLTYMAADTVTFEGDNAAVDLMDWLDQ